MICMLTAAILTICLYSDQDEAKPNVPDKATQDENTKLLKDVFKAEYSKRDRDTRTQLARKLLSDAAKVNNNDQKFVMLVEARNVASSAGDVDTAIKAINTIVTCYDVQSAGSEWSSTAQKIEALDKARKADRSAETGVLITKAYQTAAREGMADGEFKAASQAATRAQTLARYVRNAGLYEEARTLAKEIIAVAKEFKGVQAAKLKLKDTPDDPESNLIVGRLTCFVKGDWERGLPLLAKGSDSILKQLAENDLASPKESLSRAKVGDGWWEFSEKRKGYERSSIRARAALWYGKAVDTVSGIQKAQIKKRLLVFHFERLGGPESWKPFQEPKAFGQNGKTGDLITVTNDINAQELAMLKRWPKEPVDGISVRVKLVKDRPRQVHEYIQSGIAVDAGVWIACVTTLDYLAICQHDPDKRVYNPKVWKRIEPASSRLITLIIESGQYVIYLDEREVYRIPTSKSRLTSIGLTSARGPATFEEIQLRFKK